MLHRLGQTRLAARGPRAFAALGMFLRQAADLIPRGRFGRVLELRQRGAE